MRIPRTIILAAVILGVVGLAFAATAPKAVTQKSAGGTVLRKGGTNFVRASQNPNILRIATTGVQGTITVSGALSTQLKSMTCSDMKVYVGKYVTPPPPPGGLAIATFQETASAAATGAVPTCSYKVTNVPAGQEYEITIGANQPKFACNVVELGQQPSPVKLTFTKGQMDTKNFTVSPNCVIIQ